jgi:hypothetical protein
VAVLATRTPEQQATLWTEVGKGLVQLLVIGVAGTMLKLLANDYLARRRRQDELADEQHRQAELRAEFRGAIHRRLVSAINVIRKAPIVIEANQSVRTWSEQMLAIVDVGYELRLVRHELSSSRQAPHPPFSKDEREYIAASLHDMIGFIDAVGADFAASKKPLCEQQRAAERPELPDEERRRLQAGVWDALNERWPVRDLRGDVVEVAERPEQVSWQSYRDRYEQIVDVLVRSSLDSE